VQKGFLSLVSSIAEIKPSSFSKASKHSKWVDAMTEEYHALIPNDSWDFVPPPFSQNIVGCK